MTNSRNQKESDDIPPGPRYTANDEILRIEREMKQELRDAGREEELKERNWAKHISKHPDYPHFSVNNSEVTVDE
jgi:hypothetical protein